MKQKVDDNTIMQHALVFQELHQTTREQLRTEDPNIIKSHIIYRLRKEYEDLTRYFQEVTESEPYTERLRKHGRLKSIKYILNHFSL